MANFDLKDFQINISYKKNRTFPSEKTEDKEILEHKYTEAVDNDTMFKNENLMENDELAEIQDTNFEFEDPKNDKIISRYATELDR